MYVVQNLDFLTGEDKLQKDVLAKDNIEVIMGTVVKKLLGENELTGITLSGGEKEYDLIVDGMFVAIGLIPQNENFSDIITLDGGGYVDADENCLTSAKGIFVAGDCRKKRIRQVATATADGAVAALAACDYIG